jgi:hypothetical protein
MTERIVLPAFPITGGCQCGAVHYALNAPPLVFYICHCSECQKQSSSSFGESLRVRRSDLTITGDLAHYERSSPGGSVVGDFCAECGTRLFHHRDRYSSTLNIKAGTLDDTSWLRPAGHIWTQSRQPWVKIGRDELAYDRQPKDKDAALIARWTEMLAPAPDEPASAAAPTVRRQYHFRPSTRGYYAWDVRRLIDLAGNLPIIEIDPEAIAELDESFWFGGENANPTCRDLLAHMRLVEQADVAHPIILCADGRVMDGMHRVVRAIFENRKAIKAVRFDTTPEPDYVDVEARDLSYD